VLLPVESDIVSRAQLVRADIIDMLTLHPEAPRRVVRMLAEIEAST